MTPNEYQKNAVATDAVIACEEVQNFDCAFHSEEYVPELKLDYVRKNKQLLEGAMGLSSESGEALDIVKKWLFQGAILDRNHIALELGDVLWYLSIMAEALGYSLEEIMGMNVEKRSKRYPNGFDAARSANRDENDV